ncbi:MAG: PHP domain-containing protein [Candidatus Lokiarchaeota archaeon]|nr:PHP domain-containing protein [Candidatus Lokiarchaeota archaeon]
MNISKVNLHVHSNFSDGRNSIEQIVKRAIQLEMEFICITDHFSNSWKSNTIPTLNTLEKIELYLKNISNSNRSLIEKKDKLRVLKGIEIDISSDIDYITKLVNPMKFDLILFEYLENFEGIAFISNLIDDWRYFLPQNKTFPQLGLAHFDPKLFFYSNFNPLIQFMMEYNIFYEFNSSYPHSYSLEYQSFFQKLKERNIQFSIGSDSHELESLLEIETPLRMIEHYNLQDNYQILLEKLKKIPLKY